MNACALGKDVIIMALEFYAAFNSYQFDYTKKEYVHRSHYKLRTTIHIKISKICVDLNDNTIAYLSVAGLIHKISRGDVIETLIMKNRDHVMPPIAF